MLVAVLLLVADIILLAVIVACLLFLISLRWTKRHAPFVPVHKEVIAHVVSALGLTTDSVCCDLGSGDGRVLFALAQVEPQARYVGIEKHFFPYALARYQKWRRGFAQVRFVRQNIFSAPINDATHIYTYLHSDFMDALLPKLERELKPGTRLLSVDFKFTGKQASQTREHSAERFGRPQKFTLYTYLF